MQQDKTLARAACGVVQEPAIGEGSSPRSKLVQGRQEVGMLAHVTQSNRVPHCHARSFGRAQHCGADKPDIHRPDLPAARVRSTAD